MSPAEFCREIEAYLCRKNEGHLIRIVGPVFGTVTGWAEQGIPLKVAFRGIDRYFDRQKQKSRRGGVLQPRRRPVPIQFCEADILDAFDEWRRATGLSAAAAREGAAEALESAAAARETDAAARETGDTARENAGTDGIAPVPTPTPSRRRASLQTHIDRAMARLTQRRVEAGIASAFGDVIDRILAQLDMLRAEAKGARHEARARVVEALAGLDRTLLDAAIAALGRPALAAARAEAARELEPFRSRMSADAYARAIDAAMDRLIRDQARLPIVRVDEQVDCE